MVEPESVVLTTLSGRTLSRTPHRSHGDHEDETDHWSLPIMAQQTIIGKSPQIGQQELPGPDVPF